MSFGRYDIPTEVARNLLERLRVSYKERCSREIGYSFTLLHTMNGMKSTSTRKS